MRLSLLFNTLRTQVAAHTKDGDWGEWTRSQFARTTEEDIPTLEVPLRVIDEGAEHITLEFEGFDLNKVSSFRITRR